MIINKGSIRGITLPSPFSELGCLLMGAWETDEMLGSSSDGGLV